MRFKLKEHPSIFLFLISLVILGISIFICYLYNWVVYADVAIALAGAAVLVLGYSMVKDILTFEKKKREYDSSHTSKGNEHDEKRD